MEIHSAAVKDSQALRASLSSLGKLKEEVVREGPPLATSLKSSRKCSVASSRRDELKLRLKDKTL